MDLQGRAILITGAAQGLGIAPGFSGTRMVASIPPKIRDKIVSTIPLRRLAQPEEIARAALFILQNDYYNGRIFEIDGGLRL